MKAKTQGGAGGSACGCKRVQERDNCPRCEGTGRAIGFAALRASRSMPSPVAPVAGVPAGASGSYRTPDGEAQIEWKLTPGKNGLEFAATGEFGGGAGQCLDIIAAAYPSCEMVQRIFRVWKAWHLNDMTAGLPDQVERLAKRRAEYPDDIKSAPYNGDHYKWAVGTLKAAGLYEIPLPAGATCTGGFPPEVVSGQRGYRYGERCIFNALPPEVVAEVRSWSDVPAPVGSLADHKAAQFLKAHGLKIRIALSDTKPANWSPAGHHYRVTISGAGRRLTFDFWGPKNDADKCQELSAYDVLACVALDVHCPETLDDFCAEFGGEDDSIKARQTFTRAKRFADRLRAFFTADEIEALAEMY